jgi:cellobiose phosphorylase
LINLQYSLFIIKGQLCDGLLRIACNDHLGAPSDDNLDADQSQRTWMALVGAPLAGYDTSREAFLGPYRAYDRPLVVEQGHCTNSNVYGDNGCGTLQAELMLQPGETREILVLLGIGSAETLGRKTVAEFGSLERANRELIRLKEDWHAKLGSLTVETPDEDLNHMINVWALYNGLVTFNWSRAASLVITASDGLVSAIGAGYAKSWPVPDAVRERLTLITGRCLPGGAMPIVRFDHHPGHELGLMKTNIVLTTVWFFNAIPAYVAETGNVEFYNTVLPYADRGEDTVFGHLGRVLEFNLERTGKHGLPCGLSADWNDCLRLGYYGESVFVAFQVHFGLNVYAGIAETLGQPEEAVWARQQCALLDANIQQHWGWNGSSGYWRMARYGTKD